MEINESVMHEHGCFACGKRSLCYFKSLALSSILILKYYYKINYDTFEEADFIFFIYLFLIDTFPSIISRDLYSDMQCIEDCPP